MGSVRPSVHPSAFPDQTAKPGAQKERAGKGGVRSNTETERPYECAGEVRVTHVRVYKHREGAWTASIFPGRAKSPAACFPTSLTTTDATKIIAEESEARAPRQLAISQNTVIKAFH